MTDRVFTAEYDKTDVASRVWLPLGVAAVLGMSGLLMGMPMLSLLAAGLTFIALRSWPMTRHNRPALVLSAQGIEIDSLGLVKWKDIARVDFGVVQVKALKRPALDLTFTRPLQDVFNATDATRLRPWEFRIFKLRKSGQLRLDLSRMEDTPEEIIGAFKHFHGGIG